MYEESVRPEFEASSLNSCVTWDKSLILCLPLVPSFVKLGVILATMSYGCCKKSNDKVSVNISIVLCKTESQILDTIIFF